MVVQSGLIPELRSGEPLSLPLTPVCGFPLAAIRHSQAGLPELDVARVQRWCAGQVPEHVHDEVRIECDLAPRHLTICECRPPWREDYGPDWTRFPIARQHYTKTTGLWTLYWRDRNLKYHRYAPLDPSPQVQDLLDYLDGRADPIFWG